MSFQVSGDAATTRTNLGLGDAATKTVGTASGNIPLVSSLKTVGGSSIIGSGDIATLPSGGSVGQIIKKDSSNNAAWGADVGGKVLQVVSSNTSTQGSTTSTTYVDTGVAVTITPTQANSKILIIASIGGGTSHNTYNTAISFALHRDTTHLTNIFSPDAANYSADIGSTGSINYLDSPNTTSAKTYKVKYRIGNSG